MRRRTAFRLLLFLIASGFEDGPWAGAGAATATTVASTFITAKAILAFITGITRSTGYHFEFLVLHWVIFLWVGCHLRFSAE